MSRTFCLPTKASERRLSHTHNRALPSIMAELPADLKAQLKELFDATDTDGSGSVDSKEMKAFAAKMGIEASDEDVAKEMAEFDVNKDGKITFDEMCKVVASFM